MFKHLLGTSDQPLETAESQYPNLNLSDYSSIKPNPLLGRFLRNVPILTKFSQPELDIIGSFLQVRTIFPKQEIISQGDIGDGMFFLQNGSAKIVRKEQDGKNIKLIDLDIVSQYDYFGEAAVVAASGGGKRGASIIASEPCTVLYLSKNNFDELFKDSQGNLTLIFAKRGSQPQPSFTPSQASPDTPGGTTAVSPTSPSNNAAGGGGPLQKNNEPRRPLQPQTAKDPKVEKMLYAALKDHPFFKGASDDHKRLAISQMWKLQLPKNTFVIHQGDLGDNFYVMESGRVNIYISNADGKSMRKHLTMKNKGDYFGDLALLYNTPRNASIKTKDTTTLWVLDRLTLRGVMRNMTKEQLDSYMQFISSIPLFHPLSNTERTKIAESLEARSYRDGQCIVKEGQHGDSMYIILNGTVEVSKIINGNSCILTTLRVGNFFGERSLLENEPRTATVTCIGHVDVASIDQYAFVALLGPIIETLKSHLVELKNRDQQVKAQEALQDAVAPIAALAQRKRAQEEQDDDDDDNEQEDSRQQSQQSLPSPTITSSSATPKSPKSVSRQHAPSFPRRPSQYQTLMRSEITSLMTNTRQVLANSNRDFKLEDLSPLRLINETSLGYVELVRHAVTGQNFALQTILRHKVGNDSGLQRSVLTNKHTLVTLDSPFVVHLYATYKTSEKLLLLLEPCLGGDVFSLLRKSGFLSEQLTRFYIASVVLALEEIHTQGIVFRDLKPENIIFNSEGYIKLHSFGFSKRIFNERTFTTCGTPQYLAPEIIRDLGHGQGVDFWALGVLLYELLSGFPPFYRPDEKDGDFTRLFRRITICDYAPSSRLTADSWDLIQRLIQPVSSRLGGGMLLPDENPFSTIRQHPWFTGFDWAALRAQTFRSPSIPTLEKLPALPIGGPEPAYKMQDHYAVPPVDNVEWDSDF